MKRRVKEVVARKGMEFLESTYGKARLAQDCINED